MFLCAAPTALVCLLSCVPRAYAPGLGCFALRAELFFEHGENRLDILSHIVTIGNEWVHFPPEKLLIS